MESYRPTALPNILKKEFLHRYYTNTVTQPFQTLIFRLLKSLRLDNQFKNFVVGFERATFSSFKV